MNKTENKKMELIRKKVYAWEKSVRDDCLGSRFPNIDISMDLAYISAYDGISITSKDLTELAKYGLELLYIQKAYKRDHLQLVVKLATN